MYKIDEIHVPQDQSYLTIVTWLLLWFVPNILQIDHECEYRNIYRVWDDPKLLSDSAEVPMSKRSTWWFDSRQWSGRSGN